MYILIVFDNNIYKIYKEPYETDEDTHKRGWFIINNINKYKNYDELTSRSIIYLNELKNNMIY